MAVTVQQLLSDAKQLVTRLKDHDNSADCLIAQAQALNSSMETMKQYHDEIEQLNALAHQRPRSSLILNIQQENRHIRELQQENRELRSMLEEYQSAIDLIMNKYRQQVLKVSHTVQIEKEWNNKGSSKELEKRNEKISEMAVIMKKAIEIDDENYMKDQDSQARLIRENQLIRKLLEISESQDKGLAYRIGIEKASESVQTDL